MVTDAGALDRALALLAAGEVVAIPTDTVYGLAVDASRADACERIFSLKGRPDTYALPVLVSDLDEAFCLTESTLVPTLSLLGKAFWPGALSVVVRRAPSVVYVLGGDETTIGLRIPASALARELIRRCGPLAVSSANRHGGTPCTSAAQVRDIFGSDLFVLDGGPCDVAPSTVLSVADDGPRCLRAGPVSVESLSEVLGVAVQV